jgi:hypothetical protein
MLNYYQMQIQQMNVNKLILMKNVLIHRMTLLKKDKYNTLINQYQITIN